MGTMEENPHRTDEGLGIQWLDYLPVLWEYKLLVGLLFLVSVSYALISGLRAPRVYEATATIIKDSGEGGGSLLSLLTEQVAASRGGASSGRGGNIMLVLRSRTMAEYMVRQLKLQEYYGASSFQAAVGALRAATKILQPRDGPIAITVEDKDPGKAAEIANAYAENLNRHMSRFGAGVASRQRRFIEEQLTRTARDLKAEEENLRRFQETNRAVLLGDMANSMRLPGTQVPKVAMELLRLTRDQKVQEGVYTLLTQQLEQAKITEAQDLPVVQVLDPALPAGGPKPLKIGQMAAIYGVVGIFVGVLLALVLDYTARNWSEIKSRTLSAVHLSNAK